MWTKPGKDIPALDFCFRRSLYFQFWLFLCVDHHWLVIHFLDVQAASPPFLAKKQHLNRIGLDAVISAIPYPLFLTCHTVFLLLLLKELLSSYKAKSMMPDSLCNPFYPAGKMNGRNIFLPLRSLSGTKKYFFPLHCFCH